MSALWNHPLTFGEYLVLTFAIPFAINLTVELLKLGVHWVRNAS